MLTSITTTTDLLAQSGPKYGLMGIDAATTQIALINDGSPDISAVRAFNTLEAEGVSNPIFWENIGSKITFKCMLPYTSPPFAANVITQPYPTYYEYINGTYYPLGLRTQAKSPTGNFNPAPYPFGTVPSIGLDYYPAILPYITSIPGGRNGIAGLPPNPTVRNPPPAYTVLP